MVVTVVGISKKGKERINNHGSEWEIIDQREVRQLLKSTITGYLVWMNTNNNDPHFKVKKS